MDKYHSLQIEWEGRELYVETGRLAKRAAGEVTVRYGSTHVMVTLSVSKENEIERIGDRKIPLGDLALIVYNIYPAFAMGLIPSGFNKREGKSNDREILDSRLTDRILRALLPKEIINTINITVKVYEYNVEDKNKCKPAVPGLIGAAILCKMLLPDKMLTVAAINIGLEEDTFVFNQVNDNGSLDMYVAYTAEEVVMIDASANELDRSTIVKAIEEGKQRVQPILNFINDFCKQVEEAPRVTTKIQFKEEPIQIVEKITEYAHNTLENLYDAHYTDKNERHEAFSKYKLEAINHLTQDSNIEAAEVIFYLSKLQSQIFRKKILDEGIRVDGRSVKEIRDIKCFIADKWLPKMHGSALFQRGDTQSLAMVVLGSYQDEQIVEDVTGERREHFMLHYSFADSAVGEVGSSKPPGRREIGHGKLAAKGVEIVLPDKSVFPYTIRVICDTLTSDGSSSMAAVCGASLALMDTGVPIKSHVAGIAMGLIKEEERYVILSDITGEEDHYGDMDFKVAATLKGITAIQLDIKISGLSLEIVDNTLVQALEGIKSILSIMEETIAQPRPNLSDKAPKIRRIEIDKDQASKVIGTGGKNINLITDTTGAKVEIEKSKANEKYKIDKNKDSVEVTTDISKNKCGVVIMGKSNESVDKAIEMVLAFAPPEGTTDRKLPVIGAVYDSEVVGIVDFGIFVKLHMPEAWQGLVHKSAIKGIGDFPPEEFKKHVRLTQKLKVLVQEITPDNKIRLTMVNVNQETGEVMEQAAGTVNTDNNFKSFTPKKGVKRFNRKRVNNLSSDNEAPSYDKAGKSKDESNLKNEENDSKNRRSPKFF